MEESMEMTIKQIKNYEQNILFNEKNQCKKCEDCIYVCVTVCACIRAVAQACVSVCVLVFVTVLYRGR